MTLQRALTQAEPKLRDMMLRAQDTLGHVLENPDETLMRILRSSGIAASASARPRPAERTRADDQTSPTDRWPARAPDERRSTVIRSGLAGAVLGAGAAVAITGLDRRGRKEVQDQARHLATDLPRAMRSLRRDAANRVQGLAATIGQTLDRGQVSDEVLAARIESALGRGIRHARAIDVSVRDGIATLSGRVLEGEHKAVIERVLRTRGVHGVDDRLKVQRDAVALSIGPLRPSPPPRLDLFQERWAPATRFVAVSLGSAAIGVGLARRGILGAGLGISGGLLAARALTNMTFARLTGIGGGRRSIDVHKTITVDAPPSRVYGLWSRFEEFPRFMSHVQEVRRLDGGRSRWQVRGLGAMPVAFEAEQTLDEPDRAIAWKSVDGQPVRHSGIVRFQPEGAGTRIDIQMTYNPPGGLAGHAGARLFGTGPETALDDDMLRMQSLLEDGKTTVDGREVTSEAIEQA